MIDREDFIRRETTITAPSLIPEIRLHLASAVTPLWQATEETLEAVGLPPPYWAFAWPGGQALARLLLDTPRWIEGRRVLDFAAGSGLVAISAARAGAARVAAAEIDPFAVAAIGLNAALNGVRVSVLVDDVLDAADNAEGWDVVLAGDVCYEKPMAERVIGWLRRLAGKGTLVLLGDPGRAYLPSQGLAAVASFEVPTTLDLEDRTIRKTTVWRLLP